MAADLVRGGLRLLEIPYATAIWLRNRRYARATAQIARVAVPVVSVGNLTVGGTGKTPMVQWLAQWFVERGLRVTLVSRGYGARHGGQNDEARQLEQTLPDVPHVQNADRVAAARRAITEFHSQLIVLDDAFQHRRLHRDLDVVLIDALEPFGYGHLLPRGLLREPRSALARAAIVVLSRVDMIPSHRREEIRREVARYAPEADWVETRHRPSGLRGASGRRAPLEALAGQRVAAFCGIGNPDAFRHTLEACDYDLAGFQALADHDPYDRSTVHDLESWITSLPAPAAVLCTHKDLVKLSVDQLAGLPLWALTIELEIVAGRAALEARLQCLLSRGSSAAD